MLRLDRTADAGDYAGYIILIIVELVRHALYIIFVGPKAKLRLEGNRSAALIVNIVACLMLVCASQCTTDGKFFGDVIC